MSGNLKPWCIYSSYTHLHSKYYTICPLAHKSSLEHIDFDLEWSKVLKKYSGKKSSWTKSLEMAAKDLVSFGAFLNKLVLMLKITPQI